MSLDKLPIPGFCRFQEADKWTYQIDYGQLFEVASVFRDKFGVGSIAANQPRINLLLIDTQKDFTLKEGSLYVGGRSGEGAIEDSKRTAAFIYENLKYIYNIYSSYDTHTALQIFFPTFWETSKGEPVEAHTVITSKDLRDGKYRPNAELAHLCSDNADYLMNYAVNYCERLELAGKYQLYIWPFHCIVGSEGHSMNGIIQEAVTFHSFARRSQTCFEMKGTNPWTENYSVFSPEVLYDHDGQSLGSRNSDLFDELFKSDVLVIAGQALSHCLSSSVDDLIEEAAVRNPKFLEKIYLLEDCMSAVVVPGVADFTPQAETAIKRYKNLGINIVQSNQPIKQWPGISKLI